MSETKMGMVIPFGLSGNRLRRSAQEYRRRGMTLEALALMRRAAEQEDTASGWQALAAELRQLGCWETAARHLARTITRADRAPSAWLDLARCHAALGDKALAADCLYHLLQEDPWSPESDVARTMLPEVEDGQELRQPRRTDRLIRRGLQAWRSGDDALGLRRLRRAVRMSPAPERLMTTIALIYMAQWDFRHAVAWLGKALRAAPTDARVMCTLAAVLQQGGKRRMARAILRRAMPLCLEPHLEEQFLTTAWAMDAWPEMAAYLVQQLKRTPWRTPLLHAQATLQYERGQHDQAQETWRQILGIDPGDCRAAALLAWTKDDDTKPLPPPGRLPRAALERLHEHGGDLCRPGALRHGSEARRLLEWQLTSGDPAQEQAALTQLWQQPDWLAEQHLLRELLARADASENVRQAALVRLADMKCFEPLTMLLGDRYTVAQCQPIRENRANRPWRVFLPLLLRETRRHGQSMEIAHFAAALWLCMTRAQRLDAATSGGYLWCKAMEVLWLQHAGREAEAARLVRRMPVSARKIGRLLRQLALTLE